MKNKLLIISAVLLLGLATPAIASCGCNNGGGEEQPEVITPSISFDASSKYMIVGDTELMKAHVKNPNETDTIVYSSSKPEVVSVDEYGYVKALSTGEAEIKATYGKIAAKCTINATLGDYTPTILFKNIHTDEVNVSTGSKLDISSKIFFNFKEYDFTPTYALTNSNIGEIDGNNFIANKVGTTSLTVTGKFLNQEATPISLKINVVENIVISMKEEGGVEDNSVILFTYGKYSGESFRQSYTPVFEVYENGKKIATPTIEVKCDTQGLVTYDNSTHKVEVVSTPKVGETAYNVTYSKGTDTYSKSFPIYVNKPVVDYDGDVYDVDKYNSDLNANAIFSDFTSKDLVKVTSEDGKTEYEVDPTTHKVKELPSLSSLEERVVTQKLIIYNDIFGFKVRVNVYDKIIRTFEDLKFFNMKDAATIFTGDYYLANDINGGGATLTEHIRTMGSGYGSWGEVGFRGVFDGRGHTIDNFKVREGGIFGNLGKDSVIKNLAITNVDFDTSKGDDTPIIAPFTNGTTFENVYVYNKKISTHWNPGLVVSNIMSNCKFSHCLFKLDAEKPPYLEKQSYGCLANMCGERTTIGSKDVFSDVYLVSTLPATYDTRKDGNPTPPTYVVDVPGFYTDPIEASYTYKNLNHDKTIDDMKAKKYDFSSFSSDYWTAIDNELVWKPKH